MSAEEWKLALLKKLNLDPARPEHMAVAEACLFYVESNGDSEFWDGDTAALIETTVDPEFGDGEVEEE